MEVLVAASKLLQITPLNNDKAALFFILSDKSKAFAVADIVKRK
jgi:hypothetical protein